MKKPEDLDIRLHPVGRPPGHGRTILVLAIMGLFGCPMFGVTAWIWGRRELARIRLGQADPVDEGRVRAGMILGLVAVIQAVVVGGLVAAVVSVAYSAFLDFVNALSVGVGR
jgi:hypothetical protein